MRYCETCKAVRVVPQCPTCAGPTVTFEQRLSDRDRLFLASIKVRVDDEASPT
jgi:hypothetical protein